MQHKDLLGCSILQLKLQFSSETHLTELLFIVQQIFSSSEIKTLITDRCSEGRNALMYAAGNNEKNVLEVFLSFVEQFLNTQEIKALLLSRTPQNLTALHFALELNHKNVVETLLGYIQKKLILGWFY